MGIRWLGGKSLHTTRSITQILVGVQVVFNVSSHLHEFCCGSDYIKAYFLMSAVSCKPIIPRL